MKPQPIVAALGTKLLIMLIDLDTSP
jgi:hypothetical protein